MTTEKHSTTAPAGQAVLPSPADLNLPVQKHYLIDRLKDARDALTNCEFFLHSEEARQQVGEELTDRMRLNFHCIADSIGLADANLSAALDNAMDELPDADPRKGMPF